jgi:hypothetical protein
MTQTLATSRRHAALRGPTAYSDGAVKVDFENGVIRNIALITVGPALGKSFDIDQTTVEQFAYFVNAAGAEGIKSRWKHPEVTTRRQDDQVIQQVADDTGTLVGVIKNARVVGNQARGDLFLGSYAATLPGLGDVRSYILGVAAENPEKIGMSAFFPFEIEPVFDQMGNLVGRPARIIELIACDVVSSPAANPHGMLSTNLVGMFDPQPPSDAPLTWPAPDSTGWNDSNPQDEARAPIPEQDDGFYVDDFISDELEGMDDEQVEGLIQLCELVAGEGDSLTTNAEDAALAKSRLSRRGRAIFRAAEALGPVAAKSTIHRAARAVRRSRLEKRSGHG